MRKSFFSRLVIAFLIIHNDLVCVPATSERDKEMFEDEFLKRLLHELDLTTPPNINRNDFPILDDYLDIEEESSTLEKKILEGTSLTIGKPFEGRIHFRMPSTIYNKIIENGKLVIPSSIINFDYDVIDLKVFHILENGTYRKIIGDRKYTFEEMSKANEIEISIYNDELSRLTSTFIEFDLEISGTPYKYNNDNYLLPSEEILFKIINGNPYITYSFFTKYNKRKVRSEHNTCDKTVNDGSCCLQSFKFDVSKPPWNFIISPSVLEIKSCVGSCIKNDRATVNSNFIRYSEETQHKTCCYASEYETIKVLYATDNLGTLQFKNVTNLIAKTCSCY
uniref:TGF_BETA_2 domain-containing protein n=1 Tax=Strongyloides papillosus TaxID=174720 RepID=A0A0N5BAS9_STREA